MQRKPWYERWWLYWNDWPAWRAAECAAGYHDRFYDKNHKNLKYPTDNAGTESSGYYVTHCRYCKYEDKWESWGE